MGMMADLCDHVPAGADGVISNLVDTPRRGETLDFYAGAIYGIFVMDEFRRNAPGSDMAMAFLSLTSALARIAIDEEAKCAS